MCGILHIKNLKDNHRVNDICKVLWQHQASRGRDGFGMVGIDKQAIGLYRETKEEDMRKVLDETSFDEILFHHRQPTSTENDIKSTHPFYIKRYDKEYYFVHNGVINNADELRKKHKRFKIKYTSFHKKNGEFNDSETLAYEFILWINGRIKKIRARGSVAFVCIEKEKGFCSKLYFYRNTDTLSNLKFYKDKTIFLLASEGEYDEIEENILFYYDYPSKKIYEKCPLKIDSYWFYRDDQDDDINYWHNNRRNLLEGGSLHRKSGIDSMSDVDEIENYEEFGYRTKLTLGDAYTNQQKKMIIKILALERQLDTNERRREGYLKNYEYEKANSLVKRSKDLTSGIEKIEKRYFWSLNQPVPSKERGLGV